MKIDRNEFIGGIIVVLAVLASSIIAGLSLGETRHSPSPIPKKPFVIHVSREVMDEEPRT